MYDVGAERKEKGDQHLNLYVYSHVIYLFLQPVPTYFTETSFSPKNHKARLLRNIIRTKFRGPPGPQLQVGGPSGAQAASNTPGASNTPDG